MNLLLLTHLKIQNVGSSLKMICEYLGGSRDEPPLAPFGFLATAWWRGIWWGLLAGAILMFCGQTSKFIYIDF